MLKQIEVMPNRDFEFRQIRVTTAYFKSLIDT